jgi:hypothetical protein
MYLRERFLHQYIELELLNFPLTLHYVKTFQSLNRYYHPICDCYYLYSHFLQ